MVRSVFFIVLLAIGPAVRAADVAAAPSKPVVMVMPFAMLSDEAKNTWIGQAITQNLQAELGRDPAVRIVGNISIASAARPTTGPVTIDEQAALNLAQKAGANVVVVGSYQVVSTEVRVTGRILDPATGQALGYIKATASQRQLFALEDLLAEQARNVLGLGELATKQDAAEAEPQYDDKVTSSRPTRANETPVETPVAESEPPGAGYEPAAPYAFSDPYIPAYSYAPSYLTPGYYYTYNNDPFAYRYTSLYSPTYGYPVFRPYCTPSYISLGFYHGYSSTYRRPWYGQSIHRNPDADRRPWVPDRSRGSIGSDGPRLHPPAAVDPPKRSREIVKVHNEPKKGPVATRDDTRAKPPVDSRPETTNLKRGRDDAKPSRPAEVARTNDDAKSSRATATRREAPTAGRNEGQSRQPVRVERPSSPPPRAERPVERPSSPSPRAERPSSPPPRAERPVERPSSPPPRAERPVERPSTPSPARAERPSPPPQSSGSNGRNDSGSSAGRPNRR